MQGSVRYNLMFAAVVCVVCAVMVSGAAVSLRDRQAANRLLEKQKNVLMAAGLAVADERLSSEDVATRFEPVRQVVIDLRTGDEVADVDAAAFDERAAAADPNTSEVAPTNSSGLSRLAHHALVYEVQDDSGALESVILPVRGLGLWSTLYGFVALDADLVTVVGLTFYEHGETPGLGGEVDNPNWKALWKGRKAFDGDEVRIQVVRGRAGTAAEDPYRVDGLAGATITSRGVTNLLRFWLGEHGFDKYLERRAARRPLARSPQRLSDGGRG